jgi:ATP-dependent Clp protease adaptor protein ClpS
MSTQAHSDTSILEEVRVQPISLYKVVMLNDDTTHMNFVVEVLCEVFHKTAEEAQTIMLNIHGTGKGVAGVYDKEVAHTKQDESLDLAKMNGFNEFGVVVELL